MTQSRFRARKSRRRPTRQDVARLAGVSPAVVSYTLNGGSRPVAAGTRERVLAAVRQLGYQPDAAARSLSSGRPGLVGLIVPEIQNPYFAWLGHAVEVAATERGLSVVFANSTDDSELRLVQALSGRLLTGLILATQPSMEATRQIISSGIAAVLVNQPRVSSVLPTLGPDYYGGTTEVVRHLAEVHGCQSIAFAGDPNASDDRQRAWRDTVAQLGLEQVDIIPTDYRLSGGHPRRSRAVDQVGASRCRVRGLRPTRLRVARRPG